MRLFPLGRLVPLMLAIFLGCITRVPAQTIDPSSADSLAATLEMLTGAAGRDAAIGNDPAAAQIDRQVQALAGSPQLAQEVYALAGQILAELMKNTDGDMGKLMETLDRARTDPAGFAARLSPQTLQRLSELSAKIAATRR